MKTSSGKKEKSFWLEWLTNFALILSLLFALVMIPYAVMKSLFPVWSYLTAILILIMYIIFWGVNHRIGKISVEF